MEYSEDRPLVSVISCFYNRADSARQSVESLLAQTYRNLEILLVDDGSRDNTLERLSSYKDPRIKLIAHSNKGFVRALCNAIANSSGDLIAIHGSGDISFPTRIEQQANLLINNPDIGVVGCYVRNFNIIRRKWDIFRPSVDGDQLATLVRRNCFTHGEVMFRRRCYEQVGGYREFFQFAQDRDLWLRMAPITRFAIIPEVLYQREPDKGSVTKNPQKSRKQVYLSEFAVYCANIRKESGYDPLDVDGYEAFQSITKKCNLRLSSRLRGLALRYLADGDVATAHEFIVESLSLHPSSSKSRHFLTVLSFAIRNPILTICLQSIFRWRLEVFCYQQFAKRVLANLSKTT